MTQHDRNPLQRRSNTDFDLVRPNLSNGTRSNAVAACPLGRLGLVLFLQAKSCSIGLIQMSWGGLRCTVFVLPPPCLPPARLLRRRRARPINRSSGENIWCDSRHAPIATRPAAFSASLT